MTTRNGKGYKIAGGISFGMIVTIIGLYVMLSDRAKESGEAKATVKMRVEAVEKQVEHLETHAKETDNKLNGEDGLVASVAVIKFELKALNKQGVQILEKLDDLSKKKP